MPNMDYPGPCLSCIGNTCNGDRPWDDTRTETQEEDHDS